MAHWLVIGGLFGLLFERLRGSTAIRKSVLFGLAILAATVPFDLATAIADSAPLGGVLVDIVELLAFTSVLGIGFDLATLRKHGFGRFAKPRQTASELATLSGAAFALPVGTSVATAAIGVIGGVLTGSFKELVAYIVNGIGPMFLPPGTPGG
jgi:hypothetical protein